MKRQVTAFCGLLLAATFATAQEAAQQPEQPKDEAKTELSDKQKASYGIGRNIGSTFQQQGLADIDPKQLAQGILDVYAGKDSPISEEDLNAAIQAFQRQMVARQAEQQKAAAEANRKAGEEFLAENKKKEGVTTLPSGLQYSVLNQGDGPKPKASDTVTTNYRGTLIDGTEFDSSYKRGEPAQFPVNGVIRGWTEALQLMSVGSKWRLYVPAELAYGETPPPQSPIGPNSVLVFDVELLSID